MAKLLDIVGKSASVNIRSGQVELKQPITTADTTYRKCNVPKALRAQVPSAQMPRTAVATSP